MADSPRWCEVCQKYGDHHTDRHRFPNHSATPRTFTTDPFIEALVEDVRSTLEHNRKRKVTFNEAVVWVLHDFAWCGTDKPAFGHFSPTMYSHVKNVLNSNKESLESE
jgi:hypothetical protein